MTNPRLGHKKSRNGCMQCKRRRVKCDEGRPCSNCMRHKAECSLLTSPPSESQTERGSRQHTVTIQPKTNSPHADTQTPLQQPSPTPTLTAPIPYPHYSNLLSYEQTNWWMTDLELLHHYTTSTCFTLVDTPSRLHVFQVMLPQLAIQHDFLMHGILAFAAMHLAHSRPEQSGVHSMAVSYHEPLAIAGFQAALCDVTRENGHALIANSSLLTFFPFAQQTAAHCSGAPLALPDIADSFGLVSSSRSLLHNPALRDIQRTGPLAALFQYPKPVPDVVLSSIFALELNKLDAWNTENQIYISDPASQIACSVAISCLRSIYGRLCADKSYKELAVTSWPGQLPPAFLDLVRQRHATALVILGHFAALVNHVGEAWYLRAWGHAALKCVLDAIDSRQRAWLGEVLRWVEGGIDVF